MRITESLMKMKELQYCHRDIQPENIIVSYDENKNELIKLIDFGTASKLSKN